MNIWYLALPVVQNVIHKKTIDLENLIGRLPLSAGKSFETPMSQAVTKNLTPDPDQGIGSKNNADIERAIRYSVNQHGEQIMP